MSAIPRPTSGPISGPISEAGARPVERWIKRQAHATVVSEDATPFVNANTLQELGNL
jgi:molybdopterin-guanine dinucleotide biosynthesis protein A